MTDQTTSPTVTPDPDRDGVILHLPEITYLDTQAWAVDVGLTTEGLAALRTLLAVLPAPVDRTAVLREAADQYAKLTDQNEAYDREHGELDEEARLRHEVVRDMVAGLRRMADECPECGTTGACNGGPCPLRRVADETAATETQDEAWQREWDRRPDGADVSDLFEIVAVVPCSGTLFSAHQPHTWEPQPGAPAVHCPGERQPAVGARQAETERCAHCNHPKGDHDGRADHRAKYPPHVAGEPWCHVCNAPCDYAAGARQDGAQR